MFASEWKFVYMDFEHLRKIATYKKGQVDTFYKRMFLKFPFKDANEMFEI